MSQLILTRDQARKIILHATGLSKKAQFGKGRGVNNKQYVKAIKDGLKDRLF